MTWPTDDPQPIIIMHSSPISNLYSIINQKTIPLSPFW
jgi:hypothetical protein